MIVSELSKTALEQASQALARLDDDRARHIGSIGLCRLEPKPAREPYEALVRAVAYQQLHARAGDAIGRWTVGNFDDLNFTARNSIARNRKRCGQPVLRVS
jgi:3-methyladenine DNA glycosylase/8-oxoguanine DNA glycosylase